MDYNKLNELAKSLIVLFRGQHDMTNQEMLESVRYAESKYESAGSAGIDLKMYEQLWPLMKSDKQDEVYTRLTSMGVKPELAKELLPKMEVCLENDVSWFLEDLKKEYGVKYSDIEYETGLSAAFISAIVRGDDKISKEYALALALYFRLTLEETTEFLKMCNKPFNNEIPDTVYKMFVGSNKYDVKEWVNECRRLAEDTRSDIDEFFYKPSFDIKK